MKIKVGLKCLMLKIRLYILFIFFAFEWSLCFSQNLLPQARLPQMTTDFFNGRPYVKPPSNVIGDINFNEEWRPASVTLYTDESKKIDGLLAKYNIYFNELDFNTTDGVKALEGEKIKTFSIMDSSLHNFINAKHFEKGNPPVVGFLEVIVVGEMPLYKFHYILVKNPDYSAVLNAGSRDTRLFKKHTFYTAKGNTLFEIKGKKKMLLLFGEKASNVDQFIKINHLSIGEQWDLIKIFRFSNDLK
jgi:hypothetical protein